MTGLVPLTRQHGLARVGGDGYPPRGAKPSAVVAWADERVRRLGLVPAAQHPDAIPCPVCDGRGYLVALDGSERWCPGDCRHTGTLRPPRYSCPTCRYGEGFVADAKGQSIPCPTCTTSQGAVIRRLQAARMPEAYLPWTLLTFADRMLEGGTRTEAWATASGLASDPHTFAQQHGPAGIYLHGPAGVGKTGLAAATLRAILEGAPHRGRWLAWRSFLGELRQAMRSDAIIGPDELVSLAGAADVLVVDDLGAHGQGGTDWQRDVAWRLFEARIQLHATRPAVTIVTSNLAPDSLEAALGAPVVSRIRAVALPVSVAGEDARRAA